MVLKYVILSGLLLIGLTSFARAQNADVCAGLLRSIEAMEQELSANSVEGIADNSVPRLALQETKAVKLAIFIQTNITLLERNKCSQFPKYPIAEGAYLLNAMQCATERLKTRATGSRDVPAVCNRDDWKRPQEKK